MIKNFVFDTNVLISAFLSQNSKPFLSFKLAKESGDVIISKEMFAEFKEVLFRSKFDKYLSKEKRTQILEMIYNETTFILPIETITDCRDPKDNKFLELAVAAKASCLITGDNDLLVLHPFRNIPILNASDFLNQY